MNPVIAKNVAKIGFGVVTSLVLGTIVKFDSKVGDKIDAHYDAPNENTPSE